MTRGYKTLIMKNEMSSTSRYDVSKECINSKGKRVGGDFSNHGTENN